MLKENERIDELHINDYKIIQNPSKFCFSMDAVLLSSFAMVKEDEVLLDLGTGTGIIPILLEAKSKGKHFTGLEVQSESVDMAKRSVTLNGLEKKLDIIEGDIKEADKLFPLSSFDVITTNPPYMEPSSGLKNPSSAKAIARHEVLCSLRDIVSVSARLLKVRGRFYMVHRPHRIAEIIDTLREFELEPKRIRFVHPYVNKEANMVLIEAVRKAKPMVKLDPPLIVYDDVNQYSDEIYQIYGYKKED